MVDVAGQAGNVARNLRCRGLGALREFASIVRYSVQSTTDPDPVLDADWDVLVVLDACRGDLFAEVTADGDCGFLTDGSATRTSPASSSEEWLQAVFGEASDDALSDIAYVTGNPYSASHVDASRFHSVAEVWRYAWDDDLGTIPPRPITDAAIDTWRHGESGPDRLIVHYMQPHFPSIPANAETADDGIELDRFGETSLSVWDDLRFGHRTVDEAWVAYRRNLEYVLDDLALLFSNLAADSAVVTADHGNAFGEHAIYGHPGGVDLPCLRTVPWCAVSPTDDHTHEPATATADGEVDGDETDDEAVIEDRLEDLGYRT